LVYHSSDRYAPCGYNAESAVTLGADLEALHARGITVVPVYWIVEWALGLRDGSTLPAKVVGITADDGYDMDWTSIYLENATCPNRQSFKDVLLDFKAEHPEYPWYSPHISSFVIASPVERSYYHDNATPPYMYQTDSWWAAAQASGFMEIYNHSADHDDEQLTYQQHDPDLGIDLPVGGYYDGDWHGRGNFNRVNNDETSRYEVTNAAAYIERVTNAWPDLFAYPFGGASVPQPGLLNYLINRQDEHHTLAAFTDRTVFVSRAYVQSNGAAGPYLLGRFVQGRDWTSPSGFQALLNSAGY
jgi:hypothetical protein